MHLPQNFLSCQTNELKFYQRLLNTFLAQPSEPPAPVSPAQTTPTPTAPEEIPEEPVATYEQELAPEPATYDYIEPDYVVPPPEYDEPALAPEPDTPIVQEERVEDTEEGYNYPVPDNPLELPERPQDILDDSAAEANSEDNVVAPLALYGI